jgi:hypothetical protein
MKLKKSWEGFSHQNKTMLSTPPSSDEHKENGAHQMWNKNNAFNSTKVWCARRKWCSSDVGGKSCFQFHPSPMSTKKTVLIGCGRKGMLLNPPTSDVHKENGAHQTWNKNYAFNSTHVWCARRNRCSSDVGRTWIF